MITVMLSLCVGSFVMQSVIFLFVEDVIERVSEPVRSFYFFWAWATMIVFCVSALFLIGYFLVIPVTKDLFS